MAQTDKRFAFFFPGLRMLSNAEIAALPEDKRRAAESSRQQGVWLEIPCPDDACIQSDGKICVEAVTPGGKADRGVWLNIFCPEDSCLFKSGTELP
jgi:hypothetical protein